MWMNKRFFTFLLIVLAGMLFLTMGVPTADDVPDEMAIENEGYKTDKKGDRNARTKQNIPRSGYRMWPHIPGPRQRLHGCSQHKVISVCGYKPESP